MSARFLFFTLISFCIAVLLISPVVRTGLEKYATYIIGFLFIFNLAVVLLVSLRIALRKLDLI